MLREKVRGGGGGERHKRRGVYGEGVGGLEERNMGVVVKKRKECKDGGSSAAVGEE